MGAAGGHSGTVSKRKQGKLVGGSEPAGDSVHRMLRIR